MSLDSVKSGLRRINSIPASPCCEQSDDPKPRERIALPMPRGTCLPLHMPLLKRLNVLKRVVRGTSRPQHVLLPHNNNPPSGDQPGSVSQAGTVCGKGMPWTCTHKHHICSLQATNTLLRAENECLESELEHARTNLEQLRLSYVCPCGRPMPPDQFCVAPPAAHNPGSTAYPEALKAARARHSQQRTKQSSIPLPSIRTKV